MKGNTKVKYVKNSFIGDKINIHVGILTKNQKSKLEKYFIVKNDFFVYAK